MGDWRGELRAALSASKERAEQMQRQAARAKAEEEHELEAWCALVGPFLANVLAPAFEELKAELERSGVVAEVFTIGASSAERNEGYGILVKGRTGFRYHVKARVLDGQVVALGWSASDASGHGRTWEPIRHASQWATAQTQVTQQDVIDDFLRRYLPTLSEPC